MRLWTRAQRPSRSRPVSKWAAALVAVFALGAGEAAAQLTADNTFDGNGLRVDVAARVTEGANTPITVTLKGERHRRY